LLALPTRRSSYLIVESALLTTAQITAGTAATFIVVPGNFFNVVRRPALLPFRYQAVHFVIVDKSTVYTLRNGMTGRHIEHIAVAQQLFGTALIQNGAGVNFGRHLKRYTSRNIGFDQTGDRKSTRLNSSHVKISYAVFCLKKKKTTYTTAHID